MEENLNNEKMVKDGNLDVKETKSSWWKRKSAWQKTAFTLSIAILVLAIAFLITLLFARQIYGNAFADSLYGEGVANGIDAISNYFVSNNIGMNIVWSLVTIFVSFIIAFVLDFLIKLVTMSATRKVKTTASLIRSLVKYATVLVAVAILLSIWGVNVAGIVASIGVLTLVIGLGCQSLISDIVSGLFIVFDDYFSVGDMVIVDGFRGYVEEIGLRAIKLNDNCGNIKSINNGSISSCVNLSRQPNYISITMDASYNEDVERVEALIINEIEELKKKIPNIVDGPWYKGIDNITASSIDFLVLAFVSEDNRFQVTRDLKREFYLLFKKNNVQIPYTQVTVNPEDDKNRQKASPEEVLVALKEQKKLRGIKDEEPPKKKKDVKATAIKKVKESLKKTQEELED